MIRALVAAVALAVCASASAHDWYDPWCCNDQDCKPYPAENVRTTPGGYLLHDGTLVPYAEARPSADGRYHRCVLAGQQRCLYVPPSGF